MSRRVLHSLVPVAAVLVLLGACSRGEKDDGATVDRTTTTVAAGPTGPSTSTPTAGGGATPTTVASGPTTTGAPPAGGGTTATDGVIELTIAGGNVEGGVRREKVKQGAQVTLRITSDIADEIHVHTYDQKVDLVAGQSADLTFLARIPGVFEVELEQRGKKVLELEVTK